ncbi:MAG TPA: M23 family metallopeptidase [Rhodospirillales bacterium]|nr:M23 family metallopeptidase [Rhodospirillales bacterium]
MPVEAKMRFGALVLVLAVTSCGWAEWPPPGSGRPVNSRAAAPAPRGAGGARLFVGASAVVVGKGDTVYALSRRHRVSVRAIIEANDLRPPYLLSIGQRIELPRVREHVVARGETLSGIARRYGIGPYTLARANAIAAPYTIGVGQRLLLPGAPERKIQPQVRTKAPGKAKRRIVARVRPPAAVPRPPARSGRGFAWPVKGRVISRFGPKAKGLQNDGINIAAPRGAPVVAAENGVVAYAGNELRGFGNLLLIKHSGGWVTAYAHNGRLLVKRGEKVKKGQNIATVGSTGSVDKPQLHFELRRGMRATDPSKYLQG